MAKNKRRSEENDMQVEDENREQQAQLAEGEAHPAAASAEGAGTPEAPTEPLLEAQTDAAPFSLDDLAANADLVPPAPRSSGQFSGEDLEFESFMFDAGDGRGIAIPTPDVTGEPVPAPGAVEVSGQEVPPPTYPGTFIAGQNVPAAPPAPNTHYFTGGPAGLPATLPGTASGWNDQMLSAVEDFSQVLFALRGIQVAQHAPGPEMAIQGWSAAGEGYTLDIEPLKPEEMLETVGEAEPLEAAGAVETVEAHEVVETADVVGAVEAVEEPEPVQAVEAEPVEAKAVEAAEPEQAVEEMQAASPDAGFIEALSAPSAEAAPVSDAAWMSALAPAAAAPAEESEGEPTAMQVQVEEAAAQEEPEMLLEPVWAEEAVEMPEVEDPTQVAEAFEAVESVQPSEAVQAGEAEEPEQAPAVIEPEHIGEPVETGEPEAVAIAAESPADSMEEAPAPPEMAASAAENEPEPRVEAETTEVAAPQLEAAALDEEEMPALEKAEMAAAVAGDEARSDEGEETPYVSVLEMDLPPRTAERTAEEGPEITAETVVPEPAAEEAVAFAEAPGDVESEEAFQMPDMTTLPPAERAKAEEDAAAKAWMSEVSMTFEAIAAEAQPDLTGTEQPVTPAPAGDFKAEEMEFETFMFDAGAHAALPSLPNMGDFMPAVRDMEAAFDHAASTGDQTGQYGAYSQAGATEAPAEEPLPFWLQEAGGEGAEGEGYTPLPEAQPATLADASSFSMSDNPVFEEGDNAQTLAQILAPALEEVEEYEEEDVDFAELPPIEPFDFTMIPVPEQAEELGFRSEELAGMTNAGGHEPMMATANLDVLADLLGKDRASGMLDIRSMTQGVDNLLGAAPAPPQPQPARADDYASTLTPSGESAGWGAEDLQGARSLQPGEAVDEGDAIVASEVSQHTTEELTVADLDVAPFDITELQLEDQEDGTSVLYASQVDAEEIMQQREGKIFTDTLFSRPRFMQAQQPKNWDAPEWMQQEQAGAPAAQVTPGDMSAGGFAPAEGEGRGQAVEEMPAQLTAVQAETGYEAAAAAAVQTDPTDSIFKVRVSRFKIPDTGLLSSAAEPVGRIQPQVPAHNYPPVSPVPVAVQGVSQPTASTASTAASTPRPIDPSTLSGPLPALNDFQDLQEIVRQRPDDLGAHLALAGAFAEAGHLDHALAEYRQLLKKRHVPAPMLVMIEEHLSDIESDAAGLSRFHQVRGDLFMKQGRYQEAIEEYNKLN